MEKRELSQHICQQYTEELEEIRNKVMEMGGLVEKQLADAVLALVEGDAEAAQRVVGSDWKVNALEVGLDEECVRILVRRQPAAGDLRLIQAVTKTITDLERIGDEAERVGRMALRRIEAGADTQVVSEMENLGAQVRLMLRGALDAFARMDEEHAVLVAHQDIQADRQYEAIMRELLEHMQAEPASVPRVMDAIWAARSLERIGDRSRNICEYVVYLVKGKDVRHTSFEQLAERAGVAPGKT